MSNQVRSVDDASFQAEVLDAGAVVLVDFWAPWCGPCKSMKRVLEELAEEFAGRIEVRMMDVDDNIRVPSRYDVRGIPNFVLFKNGVVVDQIVGAVPKEQLAAVILRAI